jgi:regulator of RNase E activity RraA
MPGDIVLGDEDGVTVVPRDVAEEVADLVEALQAREAARIEAIAGGEIFKAQIDESLRAKGILE